MRRFWSDDDRAEINRLRSEGASWHDIGMQFRVSANTARSVAYRSRDSYSPSPAAPTKEFDPVADHKRKQDERAKQQQIIEAVREQSFRDFLTELVNESVAPIPRQQRPIRPAKSRAAHERFPLLTFNDWHFEERVNSAGVLGLNAYDIEIACRRVWRVVQAAIDWKRDMEAGGRYAVPGITVGLLGDLLTGTLHGLERHSDAPNIVRASLACGDLVAMAIADLAAEFGSVEVVGIVGNHGRLPDDRKVPTKDPTRSWDFLAYQVARRRLSNDANIVWHLPDSYGVLFEVGGHQCYASHGNFIPNNLGVVGYGVRRFTTALSSNLNAAGKKLRYCFFGHWHQSSSAEFAGLQTFICPSLIGTQEYSFLSGGSVNRPAQKIFVFDRDLGYVSEETIYGDGPGYDGAYKLAI